MLKYKEVALLREMSDPCKRYQDIAQQMGTTEAAIKMQAMRVCKRLGADNRSHAVQLARMYRIIESRP